MPTYQYACTECGHDFEQFQSFSDDTLTECPQCSGRLRKLFNAVGVVFKGSGFYRNDSRASAPSEGGASSESDGSGSEKSSDPKSGDSTKSDGTKSDGGSSSGGDTKTAAASGAVSSGSSSSQSSSGAAGS